ncbi:MAG: hypothetical protein KAX78_09285, partial [Phycisphaerae bacterium]|nr:hypothetical protein [Phycisphaerae bacterium]
MTAFMFRKSHIEDHVEKIGVDVRPVLEVRADRTKLSDYGMWLTDQWPALYENIVQGPSNFHITRSFVFPGKGEVTYITLTLTNRGIVFIFPRRFSQFGEEPELPDAKDVTLDALEQFRTRWPHCKLIRVGKINEYIFDCEADQSMKILSERFTKIRVPPNGELRIRINRPTDDFNRIIEME